ncbi:hypothetical protein L1987_44151 [Smallanthus sonchifolius]|uniref:Uncharacterized protein n=1 Tax=Smallanthus sonchifolius TaxID=185202 RepID=A0ACB9GNS9_9ASTR|nr:hypothetical protein L1987_44151 [Smallanthus sonchifolius]
MFLLHHLHPQLKKKKILHLIYRLGMNLWNNTNNGMKLFNNHDFGKTNLRSLYLRSGVQTTIIADYRFHIRVFRNLLVKHVTSTGLLAFASAGLAFLFYMAGISGHDIDSSDRFVHSLCITNILQAAIRWAIDCLIKCATATPVYFMLDLETQMWTTNHKCWERPEDMDTVRTVYSVSRSKPGSDVAAETTALAAASLVFEKYMLNTPNCC